MNYAVVPIESLKWKEKSQEIPQRLDSNDYLETLELDQERRITHYFRKYQSPIVDKEGNVTEYSYVLDSLKKKKISDVLVQFQDSFNTTLESRIQIKKPFITDQYLFVENPLFIEKSDKLSEAFEKLKMRIESEVQNQRIKNGLKYDVEFNTQKDIILYRISGNDTNNESISTIFRTPIIELHNDIETLFKIRSVNGYKN